MFWIFLPDSLTLQEEKQSPLTSGTDSIECLIKSEYGFVGFRFRRG